jgi:hypothetical protein
VSFAGAQDAATPTTGAPVPHPAHVHSGTCAELGDVVYGLNDVSGEALEGTPDATPASATAGEPGDVIAKSTTTVDASLDDLLAEPHAVNVHESAENIDIYIACGDITGEPDENGTLIIDLEQLKASGVTGQAILSDSGDGKTQVVITLTDASSEEVGTPSATPES